MSASARAGFTGSCTWAMRYNGSIRVMRARRWPCSAASCPPARQNTMHELSLCRAQAAQVRALAADRGARAVSRIRLVVGPLAGVEIALLKNAFPVSSLGTPAAGAALEIETVPLAVRCESCGATSEVTLNRLRCRHCDDWRTRLVSG